MSDGIVNFDPTKIKEELGKALKSYGETDYEFRERIYDATQDTSKLCRDGKIRIVRADWNRRECYLVGGPFDNLAQAYKWLEQADNADPHYIIGADIEEI